MADDQVKKIQDQFDRQGDAYIALPTVREEKILAAIVRLSQATKTDRILDVASGPGFIAMAFADSVQEAVGVDVTDHFLTYARTLAEERGLSNVLFEYGDVEAMPFPDGDFDFAVCRSAFHHFPDPDKVLGEMKRVVKPGGRLLIMDMIASEDSVKAAYHHRIEMLCDPTHAKALSPSEFTGLFAAHGLRIELERDGQVEYTVDEWISHGGPANEVADKLRTLLRASVDKDLAGIPVWLDGDTLMMGHRAKTYLVKS
jgi:ubiquinone/menaquinone biosynthesis C-methylase UbiE